MWKIRRSMRKWLELYRGTHPCMFLLQLLTSKSRSCLLVWVLLVQWGQGRWQGDHQVQVCDRKKRFISTRCKQDVRMRAWQIFLPVDVVVQTSLDDYYYCRSGVSMHRQKRGKNLIKSDKWNGEKLILLYLTYVCENCVWFCREEGCPPEET